MKNDIAAPPRSTAPSPEAVRRASGYDTVIVFCGLVSVGIAAVYWLMRLGFSNPVLTVAKPVALALFIFTFPSAATGDLFRTRYEKRQSPEAWPTSYPFLWLVGLGLSALAGRLVIATGVNAFPALAVVGVVAFLVVFVRWVPRASIWRTVLFVLGCGAFAVWASGVVWGRVYKNPLFNENFILNGNVHHDSLHLAAIGNMLRTYQVATTGVDGLRYVPYHWGTQWLFAQWSNLTGAQVLEFYQLGFPVVMIPFFFGGILAFSVATRRHRKKNVSDDLRDDSRFWFVFLAACIGIIPISALDAMGVWTSNLLISESYTVAVPCALLLLATAIVFYDRVKQPAGPRASTGRSVADMLFVLIVIPAGIPLLGYLKSSLMMLAFGLALYAFVRLRLYKRVLYSASAAITAVLFYLTYARVILPAHREGLVPLDFLKSFVQPSWWPFFLVVHLFWSWLYVFVRLREEGIGTLADLKEAASDRRILDVEAVIVVAVLGVIPGLVTHIDGGAAFYFSDVQRWLAVGLILSRMPAFLTTLVGERATEQKVKAKGLLSRVDFISLRSVVAVFLLVPVVGSMLSNAVVWPVRMARENADTRHAIYPAAIAAGIPLGIHGLLRLRDPRILDEGLRQSRNFVVWAALNRLSGISNETRRRSALFIPQSETAYWQSLSRPGACSYQPLLAPALASLAMLDGMPAFGCPVSRYYGMGSFTPRARPQTTGDAEPASLCRRARSDRLDRVIILNFEKPASATTSVIECATIQ